MYLTNIKALVRQLKTNTVPEYDKLSYLLLILVFTGLSRLSNLYDAVTKSGMYREIVETTWAQRFIVLSIGQVMATSIFIVAALLCYYVNKKGDNKRFLERFICLLVPATIINFFYALAILFAIVMPIKVVVTMIAKYTIDPMYMNALGILFFLVMVLHFWRLMYINMKEVAINQSI